MKKNILFFIVIFASTLMTAQIRYGVKAGVNRSNYRNVHNSSEPRTAFHVGAFAQIPLEKRGDQLYFQPEIIYSLLGERNELSTVDTDEIYVNYLRIPLMLKAFFNEQESQFFGEIGPYFAFNISENISDDLLLSAPNQEFDTFDFGLMLGAGYSYARKYEIYGRVGIGLSDAIENDAESSNNNLVSFQLGLAYTIN